jgi:hypothetical protein
MWGFVRYGTRLNGRRRDRFLLACSYNLEGTVPELLLSLLTQRKVSETMAVTFRQNLCFFCDTYVTVLENI